MFMDLKNRLVSRWKLHRDIRDLEHLDARLLADMGISRRDASKLVLGQISYVRVVEPVEEALPTSYGAREFIMGISERISQVLAARPVNATDTDQNGVKYKTADLSYCSCTGTAMCAGT